MSECFERHTGVYYEIPLLKMIKTVLAWPFANQTEHRCRGTRLDTYLVLLGV